MIKIRCKLCNKVHHEVHRDTVSKLVKFHCQKCKKWNLLSLPIQEKKPHAGLESDLVSDNEELSVN
jgi:phage FluMu protein Com